MKNLPLAVPTHVERTSKIQNSQMNEKPVPTHVESIAEIDSFHVVWNPEWNDGTTLKAPGADYASVH